MVAVSIFLMVVTGSVVSHFYGLKMFDATQSKLGANTSASRVMDLLTTDIRSAYNLEIGNGTSNTFTRVADNTLQQGNAVQLYYSAATNVFTRYYWNSAAKALNRITNGSSVSSNVVSSISSGSIFSLEDYAGNVRLNNQNGGVVGISLAFNALKYAGSGLATGQTNGGYQVKAKINRRAQE